MQHPLLGQIATGVLSVRHPSSCSTPVLSGGSGTSNDAAPPGVKCGSPGPASDHLSRQLGRGRAHTRNTPAHPSGARLPAHPPRADGWPGESCCTQSCNRRGAANRLRRTRRACALARDPHRAISHRAGPQRRPIRADPPRALPPACHQTNQRARLACSACSAETSGSPSSSRTRTWTASTSPAACARGDHALQRTALPSQLPQPHQHGRLIRPQRIRHIHPVKAALTGDPPLRQLDGGNNRHHPAGTASRCHDLGPVMPAVPLHIRRPPDQ